MRACAYMGPPSSEGTEAICRVPSGHFSQAPWYTLPDHLCRFRVRSIRWGYFPGQFRSPANPLRLNHTHHPSHTTRLRNINRIPIDYPLRARLRGRLTLRGLALRRNPWSFGERASHPLLSLLMSAFALPIPPRPITRSLHRPTERSATAWINPHPKLRMHVLSPVTSSQQKPLFRPVSCYAFFKGWLLLSQPPGCFGISTCFPT